MTRKPLTVRTNELTDARLTDELDAALESLPMTYRRTNASQDADVVAVGGPGWVSRATASAAAPGTRGILVADPWPVDAAAVRDVASLTCPIVVDTKWRHNPAVDRIRDGVGVYRGSRALLEVRSTTTLGSDLVRDAVGLLDLVTAVATELRELWMIRHDDRHLVLGARLIDDTVVMMTIVASNACPLSASLSISGSDGRAQLLLPDPSTAASATATVTDPAGHAMLPVGNESAHRCAARRLAAAIVDDLEPPDDLARFAGYAHLLLNAVGQE